MNRSDSTPLLKRPAMHPPHCPFSSKFPHADQQLCSHRSSLEPASGRSRAALPTYSSLEDPHLVDYFERKFGNVTGSYASRLGIGGFGASGAVGSRGRSGRSGQEVTYKLSITTADSEGSGTDAPVFVSLHGSHGTMGRRKLAKKSASAGRKPRAAGGGGGFRFRRGSTNSFKMKSPDLGDLQSLTVENAGTEERDSWLLQSVEVTNLVSKKTWLFLNNRWLSLFKEDCKTVRQLGAIKCSKTSYEVLVFTGDQDGAGTDSRIFLTLFGQAGVTRRLPLRSGPGEQRTVLKRNSSRRFVLKAVCVGPLKKARVQLEETGSSAEWLLDRLQVTDLRHPKWRYHFVCGQWLSRRRGDFQTVRELVASREPGAAPKNTTFKIKVYTGDKAGAGTDADVFLKLTGDKADSNDIALNEPTMGGRNLFERNSVDEFMYKSRYLGQLQRARVWHNNKGFAPGWYLEKLIVEDLAMGRVYEFPCAQWLADSEGDRKTSRDLIARSTSGTGVGPDGLISYTILVKTGNVRNAGTSARVYLTLRSDAETPRKRSIRGPIQSDKLFLKDGKFERDAIDEFNIDLPDLLSPVTKIDIGHDNSGPGPGWFLDWVQIYCPVTGIEQTFVCKDWLDTKSGCDKTIVEDKSLRKLRSLQEEWIAEVYTGNMQNAGTDARVFLALYGDLGKSEDIYLGDDDNKKDYFVKGKMDSFKLHLPAVGTPFKLRIGHDNSGVAAGWFLEKVVMQRPSTREAFEFRCDRWLAESEDDKSCIRELPALGSTVLESLKVHKYHVLVKTGKMRLAGTDANVYCNLFGNKSDTGNRPLKYSETNKDPFERKKEDLFTLEAIGLGDQIEKVRIGHDGTNPGAGWYLEKLTVWRDDQPDKKFEFVCDRWLDKNEDDGQIERDLTLIGSMLDKMSYNVSVKTGDVAGAGTDANVFLTIFGKNGETGERQLRASDSALNKFERNRIDMFKIESPDIGELERIRIRHDGSLPNSGWFLDWVRIAVPSRGKQYLFAAHRWLDTNEADRKLEIDIDCSEVTDIERTIPYEIIVQTGDCKGAGTDAAVFVQIYGEDGLKTDQTLLRSRSDNFEKGKEDRFKLDLIDVGPIQKIRIGHDGTGFGDGWFLEHVLIRRHALRGSRRLKLNRKSSSQARNRSLSLAQSQQLNRRKSFAAAAEPYKKDYYDDEDDEDEDGVVDLDEDDISSRKKTGARRPSVRPASAKKRRDSSPAGNTRSRSRSPYDEDNDLRLSIGDDDDDKDSRRDSRLRRRSSAVQSSKSHGRGRRPSPFDDEEDDSDIDGEDEAGDRASSRRGTLRRPSSSVGDRRRSSVKQAPLRSADNRKNFNDDDNFDDSDDDLPSSSRGKKPPSSSPSGRRYSTRPSRAALTDSLEDGDGRASRRSSVRPGSDALRRRANSMIPLRGQQRSLWRVDEESEGGFSIDDAEMDQDDLDTESLTSARALAQKRSASMVSPSGIGSRRRSTIGPARSGEGVAAGSQRQSIRRGDSIGDGSSDLTSADGFDGWSIVTAEEEIEEYWFYCKRWLAKDEDDKMIVRELLPTTKDGKPLSRLSEIVYEVRVKTGDKLGAGTDANVFITLYGAEADSGERELSKSESHRNKFENNNEDVFRLKAIDLGELRKLKIRHDDKGGGADWYLDHVIVADPKSKKEYYFPCNKWLSTSRDGGQISRDLIAVDKSHMGKNVNENLKLEKKGENVFV
uniref:Lipoxygenase homology domain-containing protein 1 n=1 Tax=Macrostomum lignano TaxID=282301 RepID=A0A1I8HA00_9PLAT